MRHLILILGDQLDRRSTALDGFDPNQDRILMIEAEEESTHVPSHKARIVLFLSAMRHFAEELRDRGWPLTYLALGCHPYPSLAEALAATVSSLKPTKLIMVKADDERVQQALTAACAKLGLPLELRPDRHFIATLEDFTRWAEGRKQLRLEHWYRHLRQKTGILMEGNRPLGGAWNFDAANREAFDARGPGWLPTPQRFPPDQLTAQVLDLVQTRFAHHPGGLDRFDWPLTPKEALAALEDFITHRLPLFGRYQDAMWQGEPWLYHSRLSAALNLKLITPLTVCHAAETAYHQGLAPLAAVEGLIRQILGWREYVRGLYHLWMPQWLTWNALSAHQPLPTFYWTGATDMACLAEVIGQILKTGYAHHIQRLMVTGLFALLLGVKPSEVHTWYLAMFVDAVEWVELPNVLGMSQHADGGRMASKPYIASGRYIERMSNYCSRCRYCPKQASGPRACPFTTLYWDFLDRHKAWLRHHPRLAQQVKNLERKGMDERHAIRLQAEALRKTYATD
ncbi:MAG: cryptochrome/photolyase family protein [Halothiobacillaceae bacterium]|jgi:deoxyribodipyrimidine photolyase-related protein